MSLLFDNACDAFDVQSACRCRVPEGGITAGEFDRIPVKTIAERAQYISSLTEDNGRIHIPLHKEDSPTLGDEYVTYVDHDLRGKLFIFGPEDDKTTVDAERVATSQVGQRLRFWTSGYTPDSYPEYYSSPVDVVEEASDVVNEDFFQELRDYVNREENASRDSLESLTAESEEQYAARCISTVHSEGRQQFRLRFQDDEITGAKDPEGIIRHELNIFPENEVVLYGEEGSPESFPLRATVTDVASDTIWLAINWDDVDARSRRATTQYIQQMGVSVEQHFNPVPYDRKRSAIKTVSQRSPWDDVLTGHRELTFDNTAASRSSIFDTDLNQEQQLAVEHALRADELFCIHGPPGTGKTRTLVEIIRRSVEAGQSVLVCADSNQAVDNVLVGSSTPGEPDPRSLHAYSQHGTEELTVKRHNARRSDSEIVRQQYAQTSGTSEVVISTNGSAATIERTFDVAVIDEATQATCASSCIPLARADAVVLAGDHKQLPPFSRTEEPPEHSIGLSLFEHLYTSGGLYEGVGVQLRRQYRMESRIAHFPNREFYDMTLESGREIESPANWPSLEGYNLGGPVETRGTSYANPTEAEVVRIVISELLNDDTIEPADIGVITPYAGQVDEISTRLPERCDGVTVDTVDAFQGSERDIILVSFVRSNGDGESGFLNRPEDGPRRLNVAITRASRYCALIGDWYTLQTEPDTNSCSDLYESLYDFLAQTGRMNNTDAALLPPSST